MTITVVEFNESGAIEVISTVPDRDWATLGNPLNQQIVLDSQANASSAKNYVDNGQLKDRQGFELLLSAAQIVANGTDEAIISGIPSGVQVEWPDGQTDIVTGGEIRFSVDLAGTYTFRFTAVPYLDQEVTIEALAAN